MKRTFFTIALMLMMHSLFALNFTVDGMDYSTISDTTITITKNHRIGDVVIPSKVNFSGKEYTVKRIGISAFENNPQLTSIVIPESVTEIYNAAFASCVGLQSVTLPSTLQTINSAIFFNCTSLRTINIPTSVKYILDSAFRGCASLDNIILAQSVVSIQSGAFSGCSSLKNITIPQLVSQIASGAFSGCDMLTIAVDVNNPNYSSLDGVLYNKDKTTILQCPASKTGNFDILSSVKTIGSSAFEGCIHLSSISIPSTVISVNSVAFLNCKGLTNINFGSSVKSLGYGVFYSCTNLANVTLPASITHIDVGAFDGYTGLVSFDAGNNNFSILDNVIFNKDKTKILSFPRNKAINYTIPSSVTSIADSAFFSSNIIGITIPSSVKTIGSYSFSECHGLKGIIIPPSVTEIKPGTFSNSSSISSVTLPETITTIGHDAFNYSGLTNINLPNTITTIGSSAFSSTNLVNVILPTYLSKIESGLFAFCTYLESVKIPLSVKTIEFNAFNSCVNLSNLVIPSSVQTIQNYAFSGCRSLQNIIIPSSVQTIESGAFSDTGLTNVELNNANYSSLVGVLFNKKKTTLLHCPNMMKGAFSIPSSVSTIGTVVFEGCYSLSSVTIPASVTNIEGYLFGYNSVGCDIYVYSSKPISVSSGSIFDGYKTSSSLFVPTGSKSDYLSSNAWRGFANVYEISRDTIHVSEAGGLSKAASALNAKAIGGLKISGKLDARDFRFMRDSLPALTAVDFSTTQIVAYTGKEGTEDVTVDTMTIYKENAIPRRAFFNKMSLKSINYPQTVNTFYGLAFANCSGLDSILINKNMNYIADGSLGGFAGMIKVDPANKWFSVSDNVLYRSDQNKLVQCPISKVGSFVIPNGVKALANGAFSGCRFLTSVTVPEGVTSMGDYTFIDCESLQSITIPSSVTYLGTYLFANCIGLRSLTLPINSITSIGSSAFRACTSLSSVNLPSSLLSIGDNAFYDCQNLSQIVLPASVTTIGNFSFRNCASLQTVNFGDNSSLTKIGSNAFENCVKLLTVTLPSSLSQLGSSAFSGCTGLLKFSAKLSSNLQTISSSAFYNCSGLWDVYLPDNVMKIDDKAFYGCKSLLSVDFAYWGASNINIGNYAFYNCSLMQQPSSITIGGAGNYAYYNCRGIREVTLLSSSGLGYLAFAGCSGLTKFTTLSKSGINTSAVFTGVDTTKCTLYVPFGYKADLQQQNPWKYFSRIVESDGYVLLDEPSHSIHQWYQSINMAVTGDTVTMFVSAQNTPWTATSDSPWLTVETSGNNLPTGKIVLKATANVGSYRDASLHVYGYSNPWTPADQFILFTQNALSGVTVTRKSEVDIYPNPAANMVKVSGLEASSKVQIFDVNGKCRMTTSVEADGKLDVSSLASGSYVVRINTGGKSHLRKLLKK